MFERRGSDGHEVPCSDPTLATVLRAARAIAAEAKTVVCIDHALIAACSLPIVRDAIRAEDGDADRWALALREDLVRAPPPSWRLPGPPEWGTALRALLAARPEMPRKNAVSTLFAPVMGPKHWRFTAAHRRERSAIAQAPRGAAEAGSVPYRACEPCERRHPDDVLRDAGVVFVDAFAHIVHGEPCAEVRAPDGPATTWIFDDDFTTIPFVAVALVELYGYDLSRAREVIHTVHTAGAAEIAAGIGPELREQAQELVDRARDQGFPLPPEVIEDE